MGKSQRGLLVAALALAFGGAVQAAPAFAPGGSSVFFNNFENAYRTTEACVVGGCLASTAGDPTGYQRVDPTIAGNIKANDLFIGILDVQNIRSSVSGTNTYDSAPLDRFTGYFVQKVDSVETPAPGHPTVSRINLTTAVDPFGILAAGEMFRLYAETPAFSSGGSPSNVTANILLATSGTLWAGLAPQLPEPKNGYSYTLSDLIPSNASGTEAFFALNVINQYNVGAGGYNAGVLAKINDFDETDKGGTIANPTALVCSPAELANPAIACTDLVGTSEIENNSEFGSTSPWAFASNDPFRLVQAVPEPGTLALIGVALAGLGFRRRRTA